jgi:predicted phosphodiesterase
MRGSDLIVHAATSATRRSCGALAALAPVTAVRGNNDFGDWADALRDVETIAAADAARLVHDVKSLGAPHQRVGLEARSSPGTRIDRCARCATA